MRWGAFNAAPDASTANWAFRVRTAASRSRSRATNSSAVTVSGAEGITGARAHPASRTRPSPALKRVRVRLGEHRIQGLSHFRHPDELHGLDRRSEEHTSELQSRLHLVCRLLLEKKNL